MKQKAKYRFVAAIIMIFYIALKLYSPLPPRFWILSESLLPHKTWGPQSTESHSVGSIDGRKLKKMVASSVMIDSYSTFHEHCHLVQKLQVKRRTI
jgi:hypothetical protein